MKTAVILLLLLLRLIAAAAAVLVTPPLWNPAAADRLQAAAARKLATAAAVRRDLAENLTSSSSSLAVAAARVMWYSSGKCGCYMRGLIGVNPSIGSWCSNWHWNSWRDALYCQVRSEVIVLCHTVLCSRARGCGCRCWVAQTLHLYCPLCPQAIVRIFVNRAIDSLDYLAM